MDQNEIRGIKKGVKNILVATNPITWVIGATTFIGFSIAAATYGWFKNMEKIIRELSK